MSRKVEQPNGKTLTIYDYPEWLFLPDAKKVCECGEHSQTISTAWLVRYMTRLDGFFNGLLQFD